MCLHEAIGRLGDPSPAAEETACLRLVTGGTYHVYMWVLWASDPATGVGLWPQGCICPGTSNWVEQGSRGSCRADWVSEVRYQRDPHVFACIHVRVYEYMYIYLFFHKFALSRISQKEECAICVGVSTVFSASVDLCGPPHLYAYMYMYI